MAILGAVAAAEAQATAAAAVAKSLAPRSGERQKREAEIAYSKTLPSSQPSGAQLEQQYVNSLMYPVKGQAGVSAPVGNTPTRTELAVLQDLGWQTPGVQEPPSKKDDTFNYQDKRIQESETFDYGLSDQQIKSLEDLYKDVPGFKPPDKSVADTIRVQAEQNELAPVTWKQWDKMTPDQQKAATWNSQLWKATQRDLRRADARSIQDWSPDRQDKYDARVEAIFGEGGGSEVRALNTLKLLEEINFKAVGQDLDEFLSGERLITAEEMKNFKVGNPEVVAAEIKTSSAQSVTPRAGYPGSMTPVGTASPEPVKEVTNGADLRSSANIVNLEALAVKSLDDEIRERMADPKLAGFNLDSTLAVKNMKWTSEKIPMGYSNAGERAIDPNSQEAQLETWYQVLWGNLNDPGKKVSDVIKVMQQDFVNAKFSPKEQQEVWDWLDQRTRWEGQYGRPESEGVAMRDVMEIRRELGWEK